MAHWRASPRSAARGAARPLRGRDLCWQTHQRFRARRARWLREDPVNEAILKCLKNQLTDTHRTAIAEYLHQSWGAPLEFMRPQTSTSSPSGPRPRCGRPVARHRRGGGRPRVRRLRARSPGGGDSDDDGEPAREASGRRSVSDVDPRQRTASSCVAALEPCGEIYGAAEVRRRTRRRAS
jgi:hypothetical protein